MSHAVLIYAHPYPDRSRANRVLYEAVHELHGLDARPIYDLYPDFSIDIEAEQETFDGRQVLLTAATQVRRSYGSGNEMIEAHAAGASDEFFLSCRFNQ